MVLKHNVKERDSGYFSRPAIVSGRDKIAESLFITHILNHTITRNMILASTTLVPLAVIFYSLKPAVASFFSTMDTTDIIIQ